MNASSRTMLAAALVALLLAACRSTAAPQTPLAPTLAPLVATPLAGQTVATTAITASNVAQLRLLGAWGKGTPFGAAFSPDGRTFALASSAGITLYDGQTLAERLWIDTDAHVTQVAFSPDGATLAAPRGEDVQLWRVADGAPVATFDLEALVPNKIDDGSVASLAFSPDGATLAVGWDFRTVRLIQVSDGALVRELNQGGIDYSGAAPAMAGRAAGLAQHRSLVPNPGQLLSPVVFSPDGALLAAATDYDGLQVWRVADGSLAYQLGSPDGDIHGLAFAPDSKTLALGAGGGVLLVEAEGGAPAHELEWPDDEIASVAFSPDGATVAAAGQAGRARLWPVGGGAPRDLADAQAPTLNVGGHGSVAFSPDGARIAVTSSSGFARVWDLASDTAAHMIAGPPAWIDFVAIGPDDDTAIARASYGGALELWSLRERKLIATLAGNRGDIRQVALSPDGAFIAAGYERGGVQVWRAADGTLLHTLDDHTDDVTSLNFAADSATLVSTSYDATARVWRVADGALLHTLQHGDGLYDGALSPNGATLVTSGSDHVVQLWDLGDGTLRRTISSDAAGSEGLAFAPDGATFATWASGERSQARLWRTSDGMLLHTLDIDAAYSATGVFSPDGALLITRDWSETVQVWRVADGALLHTLDPGADVRSVAVTADNTLLAAGLQTGEVVLWSLKDGTATRTAPAHVGGVAFVALADRGRQLITRGEDGVVKHWGVGP